jgi:hypothetical protein
MPTLAPVDRPLGSMTDSTPFLSGRDRAKYSVVMTCTETETVEAVAVAAIALVREEICW